MTLPPSTPSRTTLDSGGERRTAQNSLYVVAGYSHTTATSRYNWFRHELFVFTRSASKPKSR